MANATDKFRKLTAWSGRCSCGKGGYRHLSVPRCKTSRRDSHECPKYHVSKPIISQTSNLIPGFFRPNRRRRLLRICPKFKRSNVNIASLHSIESATKEWMKSPEGEEQISEVVKALAGQSELSGTPTIRKQDSDNLLGGSVSLAQRAEKDQSSSNRCETISLKYRKA